VPSFRVAYALNVAVLLAFLVWSFVDTWFWLVSRAVGSNLHAVDDPVGMFAGYWAQHSARLMLFAGLAAVAILALIIVIGRLFIGRSSGRSVSAWLAAVALFAAWTWMFVSTDSDTGAEYRARRDFHHFQEIVATLRRHHFTRGIKMASGDIIDCVQSPGHGDSFYVKYAEPRTIHESVGIGQWLDDGVYFFRLQSRRYTVEFHPRSTTPSESRLPRNRVFAKGDLVWTTDLSDGWFLTRYAASNE
jgi:hypothetical protein